MSNKSKPGELLSHNCPQYTTGMQFESRTSIWPVDAVTEGQDQLVYSTAAVLQNTVYDIKRIIRFFNSFSLANIFALSNFGTPYKIRLKTMFGYKSIEYLHQLLKSRHLIVVLFHYILIMVFLGIIK